MRFGDQYGRIKACGEKVYEEALEKAFSTSEEVVGRNSSVFAFSCFLCVYDGDKGDHETYDPGCGGTVFAGKPGIPGGEKLYAGACI